jgi:hypothetical protein
VTRQDLRKVFWLESEEDIIFIGYELVAVLSSFSGGSRHFL